MPEAVKFPHVKVKLSGKDSNAYAILGRVQLAMKKAKVPKEDINAFLQKAMSGNYDELLQTVMETVTWS